MDAWWNATCFMNTASVRCSIHMYYDGDLGGAFGV